MKRMTNWFFLGLIVGFGIIFHGCGFIDPVEILNGENLVLNSGAEEGSTMPSNWLFSEGDSIALDQNFWTSGEGFESARSLKITLDTVQIEYVHWYQTRIGRPINGKRMKMTAMVKSVGLVGQGAALIFRGDFSEEPKGEGEALATSQEFTKIEGDQDWTEYTVYLDEGMDPKTESVSIYVGLLPETTGTVYFDQITLSYED